MNWLISPYYNYTEYKNVKCRHDGTKIIFNPNIKSRNDQIKPTQFRQFSTQLL